MAKLKMKKIEICALKKHRKNLLESLQRKGVVQITDSNKDEGVLRKINTSRTRLVFEKNISLLEQALKILDSYTGVSSDPSSLKGRDSVSVSDYYTFINEVDEVIRVAHRVVVLEREVSEKKAEIVKTETQIESLRPWETLDISMKVNETSTTSVFIGTVPEELSLESLLCKIAIKAPDVKEFHAEVISAAEGQSCIFAMCRKQDSDKVDVALKQIGFSRPTLLSQSNPKEKIAELLKSIEKTKLEIEVREKEIKSYVGIRNATRFMIDYYSMRRDKYEVIDQLGYTEKTFFIYGYVPEKYSNDVFNFVKSNFGAYVNVYDVEESEDPPVLLENNKFAFPVESVLESYSLPNKNEIDPTPVMAVFYYILFGMMLSDAAYGIIMTFGCAYAISKFKNMEQGLKRSLKMFMYCGVSTTFWGFMFGSFFGDAVEVVAKTFFNNSQLQFKPLWLAPIDNPMRVLAFSFGLGVLHIFTGLAINFYQLCKSKKYKDAVYDVVFWMLLIGGAVAYLLSMEAFVEMMTLGFVLPKIASNIALVSIIVGAVGILCTAGRDSKNVFKRFLKGVYGLYNVTGYLSDILSYSRLLALGLATGVIANVFNKIGSMFGGGVAGAIAFVFVFVLGHSLNIGINLLGAYVHTNRLQFVEFFGRFYEGGGKEFSPFKVKTKYYKFQEENDNG